MDHNQINNPDKVLANGACKKEEKALSQIQSRFQDILIYHSKKLANRTKDHSSGWFYKTKVNVKVLITDEAMDAYVWLVDYIAKKCCQYKAIGRASLKTYLICVLNSKFVRYDWLSHKYGDIRYIPKAIQNLSSDHRVVFKILKRYGDDSSVWERTDYSKTEFEKLAVEVKNQLLQSGKIDLIVRPYFVEIEDYPSEERSNQIQIYIQQFKLALDNLNDIDSELIQLKYDYEYSIKEIMEYFQSNNREKELNRAGLDSSKKIYRRLEQISIIIINDVFNIPVRDRKKAISVLMEELSRSG